MLGCYNREGGAMSDSCEAIDEGYRVMFARALGLPNVQGHRGLVIAFLIDALGTGFYAPFSLLYFRKVAGLPLAATGVALTIATVLTLPMTPITGTLSDRLSARRLAIASQFLQAAGFFGYLFVHSIPVLLLTALLVTGGSRVFYAASAVLIAEVAAPNERDRWYGFIGATQNMGLGAGGVLAGLIVALNGIGGYRVLILANTLSFLLSAAFLWWYIDDPQARIPSIGNREVRGYRTVLADWPFLGLIACNVIFALCGMIVGVGLPIYATYALGVSTVVVGALFGVNTLLVVVAQTVVVRLMEPHRRTRALIGASLAWLATYGLFILTLALPRAVVVPCLLAAMGLYTLGVLLYSPTGRALAAASGPAALRGRYVAAYEFSWGIAAALAPSLFGGLYAVGPVWPWIIVAGLAGLAALTIIYLEPRLPKAAIRAHR